MKGIVVVPAAVSPCERWLDSTGSRSLLRVANRPVIAHVLDALTEAGAREIAVLVPEDLRQEIALRVERERRSHTVVRYVLREAASDGWLSVRRLAAFAGDAVTILHSSEGVLSDPLAPHLDLLADHGASLLLLTAERARGAAAVGPSAQRALGVAELRPSHATLGLAGCCVLSPGALRVASEVASSARLAGIAALAEELSASPSRVEARTVRGWHGVTSDPADLLDVNRAVLDRLRRPAASKTRGGNRLEGNVDIHPSAAVSCSVICGPAVIGAGATIKDSYIGPHTSIGERVEVEGAEIERSIVFAGASIRHVGDRLVASVIGHGTRVFKDFSVPRAARLCLGDGDEVGLC